MLGFWSPQQGRYGATTVTWKLKRVERQRWRRRHQEGVPGGGLARSPVEGPALEMQTRESLACGLLGEGGRG